MTDTAPTTENRTLPIRLPNSAYRVREYLTEKEVDRLIQAARKRGRNGARDAAAILLAYRHGLRAAELCALRWSQIDLQHGRLHVNRAKGGIESVHRCMDLSFGNIQRATSGQIRARIHDLSPNSAIGICNQQRDILRLRQIDLRNSGKTRL